MYGTGDPPERDLMIHMLSPSHPEALYPSDRYGDRVLGRRPRERLKEIVSPTLIAFIRIISSSHVISCNVVAVR